MKGLLRLTNLTQEKIAKRAAQELHPDEIINLGIGIPTLVANYVDAKHVYFHTENGMLGVEDVEKGKHDPNIVNAGKFVVGEGVGASYFDSATSFSMIRGGHVDVAILGVLQVDEIGQIANWAVPGKNIIGVGGAMDLLVGVKRVIVTMNHTSKDGKSKILKKCTYPITSTRSVDVIITDLAVFEVRQQQLYLVELMPGVELQEVIEKTDAKFINEVL